MAASSNDSLEYHVRTVLGFLIIIGGIAGGVWLGWWLCFRGDIIEILHGIKMGFPGWVWLALRLGLSGMFGLLFVLAVVAVGMAVLRGGGRK
jgi:hypothetical protein